MKGKPIVVTTEFRGVFFGYVDPDDKLENAPEKIEMTNARNCLYWSKDTRGVFGLAATGPTMNCRIGPSIPKFTAWKITSVMECMPEAAEKWEAAPWK